MGQAAYDMTEVRRRRAPQTQRKVPLRVEKGGKPRLNPVRAAMQHALQLLSAALLVGFAVYTAGIIGFVGLVIPHMVRILFGTDHKKLIPISALLGAIFLLWSDVLCRVVLPGKEIPIGVLTALVGAPVFIYLMARKKYGFGGGD